MSKKLDIDYSQYAITGKESHQCLYARSKYHLKAGGSIEEYLLGLTSGSSRSHSNHKGGRPQIDYSKWIVTGKESRNCLAQRKYNETFGENYEKHG